MENRTYGFKMAANKPFEISRHLISKNGKAVFPKEFFHEIWLINLEECKYNFYLVAI